LNIYGNVDLYFVDSDGLNRTYESNENTFEATLNTESLNCLITRSGKAIEKHHVWLYVMQTNFVKY